MRVAIFHNYLDVIGGGEKLVLGLAKGLGADIITTNVDADVVDKMGYTCDNIKSIGGVSLPPPFKQILASLRFLACDFSKKYDFFIFSGEWTIPAAMRHRPNMYYCHTPSRQFYDLYQVFLDRQGFLTKMLFRFWVFLHRPFTQYFIRHVDCIICNSLNTKNRIRKYYGKDAEIVYPFVESSNYRYEKDDGYWLSVNRFYPEKRIELQVDVFREMPEEKLVIVGGFAKGDHASGYKREMIDGLPPNVYVLGSVPEASLRGLYSKCKGLITTAIDEDFGMTPLEAMAAGKPVVAVNEGGYRETVIDGKTGVLVDANVDSLVDAVDYFSKNARRYRFACESRARDFDVSLFLEKMKDEIQANGG